MKLGIISGLGSAAGIRFAELLIREAQRRGAKEDCDFPAYILINVPFKGTSQIGVEKPGLVMTQTIHALRQMNALDCTHAIAACNSLMFWHSEFQQVFAGTLLSMVAIACERVSGKKVVGVLSSETSRQTGLYSMTLSRMGIRPIVATDPQQSTLNVAIERSIRGTQSKVDFEAVQDVILAMKKLGAESIITGCTELSLCVTPQENVIDAMQVSAEASLDMLAPTPLDLLPQ